MYPKFRKRKMVPNVRENTKWCPCCEQWLPFESFSKDCTKSGLSSKCRKCRKKQYFSDPNAYRNQWYKYHYGITANDVDNLLQIQNFCCAICGTREPGGKNNKFHLDHNHETDIIRGLLCDKCNRGLGFFDDDSEKILLAYKYLVSH